MGRAILVYRAPRISPARKAPAAERPTPATLTDAQRRVLVALCRPYRDGGSSTTPSSNQQIAGEVFLSVDAVKTHLRLLFGRFELSDLPRNQKRARLAEVALRSGVISRRDLV